MTNAVPTPKTIKNSGAKRFVAPVIGLERPKARTLSKDECLQFKLRSRPTDADSTTYDLTVGYFRSGTPEEFLRFLRNVNKVFSGQNITTGPERYAIYRRLLQGDALAAFDRAATKNGTETLDHLKRTVTELKTHVFPRKAVATQKRYMRRFLRKPRDMPIPEFVNRLVEINEQINEFPPDRAEAGADNGGNKLPDDELMDIAEFAVPATWQRTMVMHNFDPTSHTPSEFVEFCERIEFAEGVDNNNNNTKSEPKAQRDSKKRDSGGQVRAKSSERGKDKGKWCLLHKTTSHSTEECKVVNKQIENMRGQWEAANPDRYASKRQRTNSGGTHNNKKKSESFNIEELIGNKIQELFKAQMSKKTEKDSFNIEELEDLQLSENENDPDEISISS